MFFTLTLFQIHFVATAGGAGGIGAINCVGTTAGSKYQGKFRLPSLAHNSSYILIALSAFT
jgi:hypothetical protein